MKKKTMIKLREKILKKNLKMKEFLAVTQSMIQNQFYLIL